MTAHILHVLPTFDRGGLGTLGLSFVKHWRKASRHSAVAPTYKGTKPDLLADFRALDALTMEVPRNPFDPMVYVASLSEAFRMVSGQLGRPDGVLIYNFMDHVWTTMAIKRAFSSTGPVPPIICHVGTILNDAARALLRSPYTGEVRFICPSQVVADRFFDLGGPAERTQVVWNGVDLKSFAAPEVFIPGATAGCQRPIIGFTGRMAPEAKDFPALISAFREVFVRMPGTLVLAGDGPLRKVYEGMASDMGAAVRFVGSLPADDVKRFLWDLDVFCMAALPIEGMSIALVEAIAAGCAIAATDVPANREVLEGGAWGRLAAPGQLAEAIIEVAADKATWQRASRLHRARFDIQTCVDQYVGAFR